MIKGREQWSRMDAATFITPIKVWEPVAGLPSDREKQTKNQEASLFKDIFSNVVEQVYATERDADQKKYLLAAGKLDDAHSLPIAQAKAALSIDILVTMRNKVLESYNELMKMNV